jgi:hypothetical protein
MYIFILNNDDKKIASSGDPVGWIVKGMAME